MKNLMAASHCNHQSLARMLTERERDPFIFDSHLFGNLVGEFLLKVSGHHQEITRFMIYFEDNLLSSLVPHPVHDLLRRQPS